jgi:hypothetical protein
MKLRKTIAAAVFACLLILGFSSYAEPVFSDKMTMGDALNTALKQVGSSAYKDVEVMTHAGHVSGELVKRSGDVLILKTKTGRIDMKTNKEKINYILVDTKSVVGISFYTLD